MPEVPLPEPVDIRPIFEQRVTFPAEHADAVIDQMQTELRAGEWGFNREPEGGLTWVTANADVDLPGIVDRGLARRFDLPDGRPLQDSLLGEWPAPLDEVVDIAARIARELNHQWLPGNLNQGEPIDTKSVYVTLSSR